MASGSFHQDSSHEVHETLDSFRLVAETRRQVEAISQHALEMVKQHFKSPDELSQSIENKGTGVYLLQGAFVTKLALFCLGFEPGFIPPSSSKRYQWLKQILMQLESKPHCHFDKGVFVLVQPLYTVAYMAHQLHHWMAYCSGLPGYNLQSQQLYKSFWEKDKGQMSFQKAEKLTVEEIVQLRDAIHRDLDAMKFMYQLIQEIFAPANRAKQLNTGATTA
jgi:hypothetical protein